jgi:hypothetical protein
VSVTIVDVFLSFGILWRWVGRLDVGSLTIDFFSGALRFSIHSKLVRYHISTEVRAMHY